MPEMKKHATMNLRELSKLVEKTEKIIATE
jgi:hypothetical protein